MERIDRPLELERAGSDADDCRDFAEIHIENISHNAHNHIVSDRDPLFY
jgi:hypothetical protein